MATDKELLNDVNNFWIGWDQRGPESRDYDVEHGNMRKKCREFEERKKATDERIAAFEETRNKYKRREK
ncbi:hypothetical protein VH12019_00391 [Vibrio phage VH1_2019]|uniref:Uncharacterized protein n=3 Tax=Schizotequatrovirus KVP40 TaxID=1914019 RepID=A0A6B9STL3_9CAUD|nr:hypothetical protein pp2_126 [Vibrio phage phi-pp2]QHJ74310.1 hypothetical protein VH12019_00391 [Vibrio phage VH1_2019]QIW90908.1 hypothetical protein COHAPHLL_00045 [Vibrio phage V09]UNA02030.1 hypothetical protein [Vibrio phage PC-Liy1]URQ03329.1 hypothetical protein PVA8_343 [Vibrio phage PVA8]WBM59062.1 hypothetical protein vBValMPVA8_340 [Vibrio phage vB_ValM_PVA8]